MLEVKIKARGGRYVAPEGLRAALGTERARERLADAIEALVTQLDMIDGDPDLEESDAEDSFVVPYNAASTAIQHPACDIDVDAGSWTEWHTRGRHKDQLGDINCGGQLAHEDDEEDDAPERDDEPEEDDPAGQRDEDGVNTAHGDLQPEVNDLESGVFPSYGLDQSEPRPWSPANDFRSRRPHRDRIRRTRCTKVRPYMQGDEVIEYKLAAPR
jgi:hypothetical protein